jgi:hypothetical protein
VTNTVGAGAGSGNLEITFEPACVVPKLKGKKLKNVKKKLRNANCGGAKINGPRGKSAKVTKQKPKPGSVRPPGSPVKIKTS